jgi:hypothetical protein
MSPTRIFFIKIWRITTANALSISGGISLLHFVDASVYWYAIMITSISFVVYFSSAYRNMGQLSFPDPAAPVPPWSLRVTLQRIWVITLNNVLGIFGGLTYLFFVLGTGVIKLTVLIVSGYILMYIDNYRTLKQEDADAAAAARAAFNRPDTTT